MMERGQSKHFFKEERMQSRAVYLRRPGAANRVIKAAKCANAHGKRLERFHLAWQQCVFRSNL